jgi:hypothetical protein
MRSENRTVFGTINAVLTNEPSFLVDYARSTDVTAGCPALSRQGKRLQAGCYAVKGGSQPITSSDGFVKSGLLSL